MAARPRPRGILRVGSYAGIAGALLGLVGNLLHPATPIWDPEGVARTIADSRLWVPDHLAIVLGLILMLGGLVAIAHSLQDGLPAALARLGSVAAVAGITIGLILVTLDGLAAKGIAEAWTTAQQPTRRPPCSWWWLRRPSTSPWPPSSTSCSPA